MNYLKTVSEALRNGNIDKDQEIAAYNTGYGISICPNLGDDRVDTLEVVTSRYLKIEPPSEDFDDNWNAAKALIDSFVKSHNKSLFRSVAYDYIKSQNLQCHRISDNEILVWTQGYCCQNSWDLEDQLRKAGMWMVSQEFDKICGKTANYFKYRD